MASKNYFYRLLIRVVFVVLFCLNARVLTAQIAIESGEWCEDTIQTWWWYGYWWNPRERYEDYNFYAASNETVIIRLGHEEHYSYPEFTIFNPGADGEISTNSTATYTSVGIYSNEHYVYVTNSG
ncbi:hypothetical protein ACFLQL_02585 [Verrucomicrobiota bacterium]